MVIFLVVIEFVHKRFNYCGHITTNMLGFFFKVAGFCLALGQCVLKDFFLFPNLLICVLLVVVVDVHLQLVGGEAGPSSLGGFGLIHLLLRGHGPLHVDAAP